MAAAMAAATMVTRSKGGALLAGGDRKSSFRPLAPEAAFFPRRAPLFASVGLTTSLGAPPPPAPREHDAVVKKAADRPDNRDAAPRLQLGASIAAAAEEEDVAAVAAPDKGKKKQQGGKKKKKGMIVRVKIGNPHVRRLVSGAIAGAVSRTFVAPLETIRTHLMVGSRGGGAEDSVAGVFRWIMRTEGWPGLFRGNDVNVLRVAPSKAIEHFTYDTAKKHLTPKAGEPPKIPIPTPLIAGALAGVASTLCTYPMELVKTRLTIQKGVYENLLYAFIKIARDEGPGELYRGLSPSLMGVVPYAATNFYAYETLRRLYRGVTGKAEVGGVPTLLIGSAAGAIACTATFPLEVARKQMQVGALGGTRQVYKNLLHALYCILRKEGARGLYRGLGPSCIKLMPAAGISFMCYEACKKILVDEAEEEEEDKGEVEEEKAAVKASADSACPKN
ncbi:adenine nucleotide transporter BT1, chloroplastic/amyloplastic/mitochondrial [Brachypodium distachyon]|uniref:Uncharacterized protein n=1 Tax=Brachypodium distachyon TaxID=15368 RepID=I1HYI0_BRADI|nr:adenine nucleotide transporter BT1, chloroplastic/amyloplastic/mitochondrial [Brachypodium distachyon]PNT66124.1 hypothetical protein BRADI_3g07500v3 [Brachypodium distachyon]|eukprot:XP_014756143.1 adenine nucleotide transporter BT1, chloroplastic/amyloplastic/mitochondrial [Brachypodium distachyon]